MTVKLETPIIRTIALFEKITKVHAKDCVITDNCIYFIVDPKRIGMAVGKNGSVIKDVRRILNKHVKVFGYFKDPELFIKNMVPNINSVKVNNGSMTISVSNENKTSVIGRNGGNIKAIREILKRHFTIKNVKIR